MAKVLALIALLAAGAVDAFQAPARSLAVHQVKNRRRNTPRAALRQQQRRAPLDTTAHRRSTPRPPPPQAPRRSRFVLFDTDEDFGAPEVMTGKGRLGSSIDQDGKSNIWAVEPKMQARAPRPRDARHRRARARRSSRRAAAAASSRSASARRRRPADPRARARPTRRTAGAVLAVGLIIGSFLFINVEQ